MKREKFSPFEQVSEWSTRTKSKTNSLYMHISFVYEDVIRFRKQLLLTENGMTLVNSAIPNFDTTNIISNACILHILATEFQKGQELLFIVFKPILHIKHVPLKI